MPDNFINCHFQSKVIFSKCVILYESTWTIINPEQPLHPVSDKYCITQLNRTIHNNIICKRWNIIFSEDGILYDGFRTWWHQEQLVHYPVAVKHCIFQLDSAIIKKNTYPCPNWITFRIKSKSIFSKCVVLDGSARTWVEIKQYVHPVSDKYYITQMNSTILTKTIYCLVQPKIIFSKCVVLDNSTRIWGHR